MNKKAEKILVEGFPDISILSDKAKNQIIKAMERYAILMGIHMHTAKIERSEKFGRWKYRDEDVTNTQLHDRMVKEYNESLEKEPK